ncbi:MAG: DUF6364 family protein [Gemmatimonas sp.]
MHERARVEIDEPPARTLVPSYTPQDESQRGRRPVNLTLARDAIARGERFAERHGVSLSTLVTGFLHSLPDRETDAASQLSPSVRRLYGLAVGHDLSQDTYHEFLATKYGVK